MRSNKIINTTNIFPQIDSTNGMSKTKSQDLFNFKTRPSLKEIAPQQIMMGTTTNYRNTPKKVFAPRETHN